MGEADPVIQGVTIEPGPIFDGQEVDMASRSKASTQTPEKRLCLKMKPG